MKVVTPDGAFRGELLTTRWPGWWIIVSGTVFPQLFCESFKAFHPPVFDHLPEGGLVQN